MSNIFESNTITSEVKKFDKAVKKAVKGRDELSRKLGPSAGLLGGPSMDEAKRIRQELQRSLLEQPEVNQAASEYLDSIVPDLEAEYDRLDEQAQEATREYETREKELRLKKLAAEAQRDMFCRKCNDIMIRPIRELASYGRRGAPTSGNVMLTFVDTYKSPGYNSHFLKGELENKLELGTLYREHLEREALEAEERQRQQAQERAAQVKSHKEDAAKRERGDHIPTGLFRVISDR